MSECTHCEDCPGCEKPEVVPTVDTTTKLEQKQQMPIEVQSAMFLKSAIPQFRNRLESLNRSEAKRVLMAMINHPLEEIDDKFTTQEGLEAFQLASMIQDQKFILFVHSLENEALRQQEAVNKPAVEAPTGEEKPVEEIKGEVNV